MWLKVKGGRRVNTSMIKLIGPNIMLNLVGSRLYPFIDVEVEFIKKLYDNEGIDAEAIPECDGFRLPRTFTIRMDRDLKLGTDRYGLERIIAHEFVHIKQYAKGELRDSYRDPVKMWHSHKFYDDDDEITAFNAPWEQEAYGMEKQLVKDWLDSATPKQLKRYEALYTK